MMDFELKLEKPNHSRAWISAATMGSSYFVGMRGSLRPLFRIFVLTPALIGGLIPMLPYFVIGTVIHALFVSIGITVVILLVFGYIKDWFTVRTIRAGIRGAWQTLLVGALAAGASYGIVRAIDSSTL
jgi:VIT1/CCC1 family predicted Fe2+/Mn2+ transporter